MQHQPFTFIVVKKMRKGQFPPDFDLELSVTNKAKQSCEAYRKSCLIDYQQISTYQSTVIRANQ